MFFPFVDDFVAERREDYFHYQFGNSARQRASRALQKRPAKSVPKNRREDDEDDNREDKVIQKLAYKRRNIGASGIGKLAVGIFLEGFSDSPVQKVIYQRGHKERNGASQKDEPCSAQKPVKRGIIPCV